LGGHLNGKVEECITYDDRWGWREGRELVLKCNGENGRHDDTKLELLYIAWDFGVVGANRPFFKCLSEVGREGIGSEECYFARVDRKNLGVWFQRSGNVLPRRVPGDEASRRNRLFCCGLVGVAMRLSLARLGIKEGRG